MCYVNLRHCDLNDLSGAHGQTAVESKSNRSCNERITLHNTWKITFQTRTSIQDVDYANSMIDSGDFSI